MWFFSSKKSFAETGFFSGYTDCHCHILPGVDDGFREMDHSLAVLDEYARAGVETVWFTPHIMEDVPNTTAALRQRFEELKAAYKGPLNLHLAAENMIDNLFEARLEADDLLPIGDKADHLLVETSYFSAPMGFENTLRAISLQGYYPLLAHPERYAYMDRDKYREIKSMGVKFQLNLPSLAGFYSPGTRERAVWLLKQGMYDFIGTDLHRSSVWQRILDTKIESSVRKLIEAIPNSFA